MLLGMFTTKHKQINVRDYVDIRFTVSTYVLGAYIPRTNMFTVLQLRVYYKNNVSLLNGGTVSRTFVYGFLERRGERVGV